ncbi:hypothetical protein JD974_01095 [Chromobacterium haemolyticum]|uniref:Uncharacterized protein n=1 Tax=Chromobacterium haemolyticum TaxID=394935 RepID=A0ABS3GGB6_9NEIS|nr:MULTISPECIES: hypothetical protein [Chromobacterium]MBK0412989.1 hypothetical protein [Chromobacterium haemolyticum]MBO0414091.1 hypothetical protein [Chromobacterium haemolyticum]MBO0497351.1 hypothetical protein [Chromobacterium haemolyticum]WON82390.1 hypothetical protein OK026_14635 [Chromobacterium haemolyticum]BBH15226.1 hypothetical protein CH06BL_44740 [Chromobacterium haemolyticum]
MLIATEMKSGMELHADSYTQTNVEAFAASFQDGPIEIELSDAARSECARVQCAAHIEKYYPIFKQLNLLRDGDDEEKKQMSAFINACQAWSNQASGTRAELEKIKP